MRSVKPSPGESEAADNLGLKESLGRELVQARAVVQRFRRELDLRDSLLEVSRLHPSRDFWNTVLQRLLLETQSSQGCLALLEGDGNLAFMACTWLADSFGPPTDVPRFTRTEWEPSWQPVLDLSVAEVHTGPLAALGSSLTLRNVMSLALRCGNKTLGLLALGEASAPYSPEQVHLIQSVAPFLSSLIESRLQQNARDLEFKSAHLLLQQGEARLRNKLDQMCYSLMVWQAAEGEGGFVLSDMNTQATRLWQCRRSQALGKTLGELLPGESGANLRRVLRQVWQQGKAETHELSLSLDRGPLRTLQCYAYRPESNEVVLLLEDITEGRRRESALRQSERQFRMMADNSGDLIACLDTDGIFQYISPSAWCLLGFEPEELQGKSWYDHIHEEDQELVSSNHAAVLENRSSRTITFRIRHRQGHYLWMETSLHGVRAEETGHGAELQIAARDITERRIAEEALRTSERSFRETLENVNLVAIGTDAIGTITFCNSFFLRLTGWTQEEVLQRNWYDLFVALPGRQQIKSVCLKGMTTGTMPAHQDYEILTRSGRKRLVSWSNSLLRDAQGHLLGNLGIGEDITERNQAEQALNQTVLRLKDLVDNSSDWVWETDAAGHYTYSSSKVLDILGFTPAEVLGKNILDFVAPAARPQVGNVLLFASQRQERIQTLERECLHRDGRKVLLETSAAPVLNKHGLLAGFRGIDRDITRHRMAAYRIREQENLLDLASDAIVVQDMEGKVLSWNRGAERLYGWQSSEVIGYPLTNFLPRNTSALETARKRLFQAGDWSGELQQPTKEGKRVTVSSRWTLMKDPQQNPQSILIINTDITERKKLEAQFLRSQRMESIGTLASGVAHDLNNILSPIALAAPLFRQNLSSQEEEALLKAIEGSTRRAKDIIKQLLTFARGIEGNRSNLDPKVLTKEIARLAAETFPRAISVQCETQDDLWCVLGDATQIHQVLLNLCVNARDAMPEGGRLRLQAENVILDESAAASAGCSSPGKYVLLRISDDGYGIAPEILDRVFDPFFTTKPSGKGTGLGLSTVLGIVKSHQGFINVQSEVGRGTVFEVYLPAQLNAKGAPTEPSEGSVPWGEGELVLVVDDEPHIRDVLTATLAKHGYQVLAASGGFDALELHAQHGKNLRLVFTDIMMPGLDGVKLIRTLKAADPDLPCIATSGLELSQKAGSRLAELKSLGVTEYLAKPFTPEELLHTVRRVLSAQQVQRNLSIAPKTAQSLESNRPIPNLEDEPPRQTTSTEIKSEL